MSNHLRGEVTISLGNQDYNCKLNFDSLVRIETALDTPIIQLANKISNADLKVTEISYIVYTAIKGGGKDITEKEVNSLIWDVGFVDAIKACSEIIAVALSSGDEEEKK